MKLMSVPIRMNGTDLEPGRAQPLFEGISPGPGFPYDVMPDGQHFVILTLAGKGIDANLNIIQNWPAMLKRNN
jgi:hypothetical protein